MSERQPERRIESESLSPREVVEKYREDPLYRDLAEVVPHLDREPDEKVRAGLTVVLLEAYHNRTLEALSALEPGIRQERPLMHAVQTYLSEQRRLEPSHIRLDLIGRSGEIGEAARHAEAIYQEFVPKNDQ